jgi:methionine sulfoxide reductase catalytic subunit
MMIKRKRGWEIGENKVTPEALFLNRRNILMGGGAILAAGALAGCGQASTPAAAQQAAAPGPATAGGDPTRDLYPAMRNPKYVVERPVTAETITETYNNFYEYGEDKSVYRKADQLRTRPWEVKIDGLVEKPFTISFDDLIRKMPIEERVYRHRCVEAWSFVVPWTGFQLSKLVELAKPLSSAKYLKMETFNDPKMAPGLGAFWYPWPYVEALTMEEANNELAFLVTGAYGKPVVNVMGAPLRLHVPWKYGFKSIKSIVHFSFVMDRPKTFWELTGPSEYGFWANVNPGVAHARWSQQMERDLGTGSLIPTKLYNGYADFVASLYTNLRSEKLFK